MMSPTMLAQVMNPSEIGKLCERVFNDFDQQFTVESVRDLKGQKWVQVRLKNGLVKTVVL